VSAELVPVITTLPAAADQSDRHFCGSCDAGLPVNCTCPEPEPQRVITYTRYGVPLRVDPLYPAEPIFAALVAETVPLAWTSGPSVADQAEGASE